MGASIDTPEQAAAWLEGLINVEKLPDRAKVRLTLEPIHALLGLVGNPERTLRPLHVAGSKGKGSTALWSEALLRAGGLRVGTFTSPHLERWTERFRIDGSEVPGAQLAAAVERLRGPVEELREGPPENSPSWFDVTTAAALLLFADAGLDAVVLEVGLGGRLDSTNVVQSGATAITSIELEHTQILGSTLAEIASEKAGILKPEIPAVVGELPNEAREVVRARAREVGAPLSELGVDFDCVVEDLGLAGSRVRFSDGAFECDSDLAVVGAHQARNAAVALALVRRAGLLGDDALRGFGPKALANVRLPGRIERLSEHPLVLVDSCHTSASARALAAVIGSAALVKTHLVLSISSGKDLAAVVRALAPRADTVTVTCAEPVRSADPGEVESIVRQCAPRCVVESIVEPELALRTVAERAGSDDWIVAAGSVYLAGMARRILAPGAQRGG